MESSRMCGLTTLVVGVLLVMNQEGVSAFSSVTQRSVMRMESSLLDKIPNPFGGKFSSSTPAAQSSMPSVFGSFSPTPDGLVLRAKAVLSADFGVLDESLLADNFIWVGPTLGSKVLGKADFLAAGKYFDLRAAFPDLDYRAHDFRIDDSDPMTIRLTARTVGTMRGELRLRNEIVAPTGVQMRCPPEAIAMTFDEKTGKVVKLCSGFTMDRLVGNTGGLCGVMGAATTAGTPPSEWEVFPATTVLQRFFGRPVQQLEEPASFLAPFPETVMVQLSKGIVATDMAALDPDLLGPSFTFCAPFDGPIGKKQYIESYAQKVLGDSEPELTNFRVDPYDPYRVWVDVCPMDGSPQAMSFTFDDDGFCTRLTAWAVMDPSIGNSGGLGGDAGVKYASGSPPPGVVSRPLPQVLARLQKKLFSPITKVGVDEYRLERTKAESVENDVAAPSSPVSRYSLNTGTTMKPKPPAVKPPVSEKTAVDRKAEAAAARKAKAAAAAAEREAQLAKAAAEREAKLEQAASERIAKAEQAAVAQKARAAQAAAAQKQRAEAQAAARTQQAEKMAQERKALTDQMAASRKKTSELASKAEAEKAAKRASAAATMKRKAEEAATAKAKAQAAARNAMIAKQNALRAKQEQKKPAVQKRSGSFFAAKTAKPVEKKPAAFFPAKTRSLPKKSPPKKPAPTLKVAPRGVPVLSKWRKNRDGSVTGLISGSRLFEDGEKVTTSEISGEISKGSVVQTSSGSKYFLS